MNRALILVVPGLFAILAFEAVPRHVPDPMAADFSSATAHQGTEAPPLCPWRQPASDLKTWYPLATGHQAEVPILSAHLMEIKEQLGRWPTPDENPLYLHRILQGRKLLGTVLVRRVKGEYGAIEAVLAVNLDGTVRGLHLQRLREPEPIAKALRDPAWLASFEGQTRDAHWRLGGAVPDVAPAARQSAVAVVEGVRSMLILEHVAVEDSALSHH